MNSRSTWAHLYKPSKIPSASQSLNQLTKMISTRQETWSNSSRNNLRISRNLIAKRFCTNWLRKGPSKMNWRALIRKCPLRRLSLLWTPSWRGTSIWTGTLRNPSRERSLSKVNERTIKELGFHLSTQLEGLKIRRLALTISSHTLWWWAGAELWQRS